jgi:hypothetical protein
MRPGVMDRNQKIKKISNWEGRVSKISNLVVTPRYVNPDYKYEICDGFLTDTGKLEILTLIAKSGGGPYFIARWDYRPEHLDIDMHNASRSAIRKFKNNKDGYGGHHTNRTTDPNKRIFDVTIELPNSVIFDGEVSFSNTYEVKVSVHAEGKVSIDAQVIRAI